MDRRTLALLIAASQCPAAGQWRLVSEIWTSANASSHTYTAFSYTSTGQQALSRTWSGADSSAGTTISTVATTWDSKGRRSVDVVLSKTDTVSKTVYAYDSNDSLATQSVYGTGGTLSYVDTFAYSPLLSSQTRKDGSGAFVLSHRFGRDPSGRVVSDSLFSGAGPALSAVTRTTWSGGRVESDTTFTYSGSSANPTSATLLEYRGNLLGAEVHLVPYGDVLDSTTHAYDGNGNLVFDTTWSGGSVSSSVSYLWAQVGTTSIQFRPGGTVQLQRIGSDVVLISPVGTNAVLDVFSPTGRLVASLPGTDRWTLPPLPAGRNFAKLRGVPASPIAL